MEITPRPYFSYSQFSAFNYSRQRFLETYYYGKEQESVYLDMGKRLGRALQFRKEKEDEVIDKIRRQIPEAKIHEYEAKTNFQGIPLLCYFDGWDPEQFTLQEYKTGKKPSEASWRNQMLFYSLALYNEHKRLPSKITLYWCKTEMKENQLILTGQVKPYDIKVELKDVIMFAGEIIKTWEDIKRLCEHEYQQFGVLPLQKGRNK